MTYAFNAIMSLSCASTRGSYSRIEGVTDLVLLDSTAARSIFCRLPRVLGILESFRWFYDENIVLVPPVRGLVEVSRGVELVGERRNNSKFSYVSPRSIYGVI